MFHRFVFGLLLLLIPAVGHSATTTSIVVNDFEGAQTNVGGGPNNSGLAINSSTTPNVRADFDFTDATPTVVAGLSGSANAVRFDIGTGDTFQGLFDLTYADLLAAQPELGNPLLTSASLTFEYSTAASTTTDSFNELILVANTDGTDGNGFIVGSANVFAFPSGASSGLGSIEVTPLLSILDPSVNPNFSALRLVSNKDANSTIDIVIDNIGVSTVSAIPEPSSAILLGVLGAGVFASRRGRKA